MFSPRFAVVCMGFSVWVDMRFARRSFLSGLGAISAFGAGPVFGMEQKPDGIGLSYLEGLSAPGALNEKVAFIPPSRIDPAYSHVVYVNTALSGPAAQKMWVVERDGAGWKLALWDQDYWDGKGSAPEYSWPVSTGRYYQGNRRSGPTPLGVFNIDDRKTRHRRGWGSPGMYNSIYIDLHYSSGRASGVAMHGTTRSMYRRLGRADSHGCVRMEQKNADLVWKMFHGDGRPGTSSPLWSESVPRYFTSSPVQTNAARWGYVRDGSILRDEKTGERLTKPGYSALFVYFRDDL